jgi:hypothetical protein
MTVALSVVTPDGIVLAADSRTTYGIPKAPTRVLSDHTHKIFQIGSCGIATYGFAFVQKRSVASHVLDFEREINAGSNCRDPEALGKALGDFMAPRLEDHFSQVPTERPPAGADVLGFLVAGFADGDGSVFDVYLPSNSTIKRSSVADNPGASWRGQTDVIRRLVKGVDRDLLEVISQEDGKHDALTALAPTLDSMEYLIPFHAMNLQDAVDFAVFLIRTTIDTQRFTYGIHRLPGSWPGVGGPIEIAVITERAGFRWLQQTPLLGERPSGGAELAAEPRPSKPTF